MSNNYPIDGVEYPRVTGITGLLDKSDALIPWGARLTAEYAKQNYKLGMDVMDHDALMDDASKNFRDVQQEAMDIGSEVHDMIELHAKAVMQKVKYDSWSESKEEVTNAFLAYLEWEKENIEEYLASEKIVHDPVRCYAGTLDLVARLKDGKVYVIDMKASSGFYDGMAMQVSAYKAACPIKTDGQGVLRLDKKTGRPQWKDYSKVYERKRDAFYLLLDFFYTHKKRRLKNNPRVS